MHFGLPYLEEFTMHEIVEDMGLRELRGLCSTCLHADYCAYFKMQSDKVIIHCEMFEIDNGSNMDENSPEGLLKNYDMAEHL